MEGHEIVVKKKGRGPVKGPKPTPDTPIDVQFNVKMQPIRLQAGSFQSYLGTIAKNGVMFLLTYADWRDIPHKKKEDAWIEIQASMQQQLSQILDSERTPEARQRIFKETMGPECHGYVLDASSAHQHGPTLKRESIF
ncbi:hypothetical protein ACH5RR_039141 [Cinchona calisaya]|uniref:Uncharacterized protein n=1 Tax=Cinchona calisaya TaxID=153742 RepID=A0ABD2XYT5_9GENT